jgi:predicted small lipoprotein YifL
MNQMKRLNSVFVLAILLLVSSACGLRDGGLELPEATVPADLGQQAATAATRAASAAATAAVVADQASEAAATAAVQGGTAMATVQASDLPLSDVDVNSLQEKFAAVQPDENGNFSVTVTDDELNQAIQLAQAASEQSGTPVRVQNAQVVFIGGTITLTGAISVPISAQLTVVFRPFVADNMLQFEVISATAGDISVPASLLQTAESTLNDTLGAAMGSLPPTLVLQDIEMGEGTMTVTGSQS